VARPYDPCRIADQLWIGVHQLVAFLLLSAYLFRTVFPYLFAYLHSTASYRHPLRASACCRESVAWCLFSASFSDPALASGVPMLVFTIRIERSLDVAVQSPQNADAREHRRSARRRDQAKSG